MRVLVDRPTDAVLPVPGGVTIGSDRVMTWDAVSGATGYLVEWRHGPQYSDRANQNRSLQTATSVTLPPGASGRGPVTARVRAYSSSGVSAWSPERTWGSRPPTLNIFDASILEENGSVAFLVTLTPAASQTVTVDYTTIDGTATAPDDYTATSGTITFAPGETRKHTAFVLIVDDDHDDSGETFGMVLSNPTGSDANNGDAVLGDANAFASILNQDDGTDLTASYPVSSYQSSKHKGDSDSPQVIVTFSKAVEIFTKSSPSVTVTNATITSTRSHQEDGLENAWIWFLDPTGDEDVTFALLTGKDCASGGICTADGTTLSAVPATRVLPGPEQDGEDDPPVTNSKATGKPTISGTPSVSLTLTADTSGIADADGTSTSVFEYQWSAGGTDIPNATGATITLASAHEGKTITVKVTFTDDRGNVESLTSVATTAVAAAAENTPATGRPTISGTAQVGETLSASTAGVADEDGLDNVSYSYQWTAGSSDISGAGSSTYTLQDADEGKTIQVRVSFTDDAGNEESLTSDATAAVEGGSVPDKPTGLSNTATSSSVTLTWDDPGDSSITHYEIFRRDLAVDGVGVFHLIKDNTGSAATTYTDDTVVAEGGYMYRVKAVNLHGASVWSSYSQADIPADDSQQTPQSPPPAPTSLTATVNSDGQIVLSWTAPDDHSITGYRILRRRPSVGEATLLVYVADTQSTATTFTDTDVTGGVKHVYRVKAINAAGLSGWSNYVNPTP